MKILLVSLNASYMHTNLAIRDLKNYGDRHFEKKTDRPQIELAEFTINQSVTEVLREIAFTGFFVNWNVNCMCLPSPLVS